MGDEKYRIGYTCGVFDLFHVGHLNLLERCKSKCDLLIVGICDDEYVINVKNKTPVFNQKDRARIIDALSVVDKTEIINTELTNDKVLAQKHFNFDVLFSGDDWKGTERYLKCEKPLEEAGIPLEYFPYTEGISTTEIIEAVIKNERLK